MHGRSGTDLEAGGNVRRRGGFYWSTANRLLSAVFLWWEISCPSLSQRRYLDVRKQPIATVGLTSISFKLARGGATSACSGESSSDGGCGANASRSTEGMMSSCAACLSENTSTRQLLQLLPPLTRTATPPPPARRRCAYGDAYGKDGAGGCCQVCKKADERYTHYRDHDLDPSTPAEVLPCVPGVHIYMCHCMVIMVNIVRSEVHLSVSVVPRLCQQICADKEVTSCKH
jgi:hypothetical protein